MSPAGALSIMLWLDELEEVVDVLAPIPFLPGQKLPDAFVDASYIFLAAKYRDIPIMAPVSGCLRVKVMYSLSIFNHLRLFTYLARYPAAAPASPREAAYLARSLVVCC